MAVTMVIGNSPEIRTSLFAAGYSLPAVIANEFAEATGDVHVGALAGLALVLFGLSLVLNSLARLLVRVVARGPARSVA
jgi:phosphate transport system permease protein